MWSSEEIILASNKTISRKLPLFAKASVFYNSEIYPRAYSIRGATRLKNTLRNQALNSVISSVDNYDIDGDRIKSYRLQAVSRKPLFSKKMDAKYFFMEPNYLNNFLKASKGGEIFCDVGGYHGFYSLVSNSEKSIVFEADPDNSQHLKSNLALNNGRDIELIEKPVWSSNELLNFEADGTGTSCISEKGVERQGITLDRFFEDRQDPDIIKIDVEGAEGHVLEGAEKILERSHPLLFIEFHFDGRLKSFGHSFSELKTYLKNRGYDLSSVDERGSESLVIAK